MDIKALMKIVTFGLIILVGINVFSLERKIVELSFALTKKSAVKELTLKSKVFKNTRKIRVLLPPGYSEDKNKAKKYPVLYMNDGIAVVHAYKIEQVVPDLINAKRIVPLIIVCIDNGASTEESTNPIRDRANEYLPWEDTKETNPAAMLKNPQGKLYPKFLLEEVMPLVNKNFRTKMDAESMGLGGASRGALIALYTALDKPETFSKLLLESPALYVSDEKVLKMAKKAKKFPKYVYIGIGTREGDTEKINKMAVDDTAKLNKIIQKKSDKIKLKYVVEEGAKHDFGNFGKRFPKALEFLYGTD